MNSMVGFSDSATKIVSLAETENTRDRGLSNSSIVLEGSLFIALEKFNSSSQSLYNNTLVKARLDHVSYLVLQNSDIDSPISLMQLLITTELSYKSLVSVLEALENDQLITISKTGIKPEARLIALTDEGKKLLGNTKKLLHLAEQNILRELPQGGGDLKAILFAYSEKTFSLDDDITLFEDELTGNKFHDGDCSVSKVAQSEKASHDLDDFKLEEAKVAESKKISGHSKGGKMVALPTALLEGELSDVTVSDAQEEETASIIQATELKKWVLGSLTKNEGVISLQKLCAVAFGECRGKPEQAQLRQMAQTLSSEQIGLSPDPKFSFKQQEFSDCGVLFSLSFATKTVEQEKVSDQYRIAYLMLHLGMKAAQSDDIIVDAETDVIQKIVMKNPGLSATEKARLQADMKRLSMSTISLDFIALMLGDLSSKHKEGMAHLAFKVVTSDDIIETSELNFLLWLYEQLGFSHTQIQQKVKMIGHLPQSIMRNFPEQMLTNILGYHASPEGTSEGEPDAEQKSEEALSETKVSSPLVSSEAKNDELNVKRITDLREETEATNELLQQIFSEDKDENNLFDDIHEEAILEEIQRADRNSDACVKIEGLDVQHQELFHSLLESKNNDWSWFVMLARGCGLMGNGAVETLNEWGYEQHGEAVIEYDPFQINRDYFSDILGLTPSVQVKDAEGHADESKKEEDKAELPTSQDVLEQQNQKNRVFLNAVLAEQKIDQQRFEEMAASYGFTFDEAFELLK